MVTLVNRAYVSTATPGTGTLTLGAAEAGFQDFAAAGVTNGATVRYTITEGTSWEIGTGTYSSTGPTLTRTPTESSSGGSAITLGGEAGVFLTAAAEDLYQGPPVDVFYENSTTVSADYTITSGKNAVSAGPVTIASGVTVTVPSGSRWAVV
jgi:hypothetical protein